MNPQQQQQQQQQYYAPLPSVAVAPSPPVEYAPSPTPPSFQPTPLDTSAYNSRATSTGLPTVATQPGSEPNTPLPTTDLEDYSSTGGNNTPAPPPTTTQSQTPAPAPAPQPVKRSKALNFLKKKETKVNVKGTSYKIVDDEIILEDDERGETKIDDNGTLLGGRQWKVHTFTSPMRTNPEKLYMLSIDAARCAGFRDSLYFFRRNPLIHKLSCSQAEKDRLIELGKLSGNLKSRAVTMVSARNVFKVMGATFVQDGKYILDDYYEGKSLALGHKPGEPAFIEPYDPEKDTGTLAVSKGNAPPGATSLGLNVLIGHPGKPKLPGSELISSQIGGGLHATFGGTGVAPFSYDPSGYKKVKPASHLTVQDWMYEYSKEVRDFNKRYQQVRSSHLGQISLNPPGVEENQQDCWEWVEEEYTDDDEEQQGPGGGEVKPSLPQSFQTQLPSVSTSTSSQVPFDPSLPSLYGATPTPSSNPPPPPTTTITTQKKKKTRLTKRFNPIRGFYELETNVPHVYKSTQPTKVIDFYRSDLGAKIFNNPPPSNPQAQEDQKGKRRAVNGGGEINGTTTTIEEEEEKRKKRKLELAASTRGGIASLEFISCSQDRLDGGDGLVLPGMWDFQAGPEMVKKVLEEEEEMEKEKES
ncbi:hypothetical protein JCM3765_007366 [Sporobolomyces pararoseus]